MVEESHIPDELTGVDQWVCWRTEPRDGTSPKVPLDPGTGKYARVNDPETWHEFDSSLRYYRENGVVDGIGFVFDGEGPYVGVDLDECLHPETGTVEEWAVEIICRLGSYTERSPSGTGYHIILKGSVPDGGNRNGSVEMYDHARFFTVTGDRLPGTPTTVENHPAQLETIHGRYVERLDREPSLDPHVASLPLTDTDLLERAMTAANGDKFEALWNGDISGYPSHSEADLALCTMLAFWTGGDARRIEQLFARSGLARDKWRTRLDYRESTIRTALQNCTEFYDPETDR